jgi:inositol phosphorylceramide glucuronosyltransferase 1
MRRLTPLAAALGLLLSLSPLAFATDVVIAPAATPRREAYMSLLYGDFYLLPLRTLMRSLHDNSPDVSSGQRERVVLVTGSTSEKSIQRLRDDGITVLPVPQVVTPYMKDERFDPRFGAVMTKLTIFNMTQYSRIAFVDADALVLRDMSDLFNCGFFCAVFINPCHFNSGLMLVTPNPDVFDDMLHQLPKLPSYDGGDQGFLNSFYPQMLSAPVYDPSAPPVSPRPAFARLPFTFHMDHSAYYPRFRWDQPSDRCGGTMREQEWLGPTFLKPWLWFTYVFAD